MKRPASTFQKTAHTHCEQKTTASTPFVTHAAAMCATYRALRMHLLPKTDSARRVEGTSAVEVSWPGSRARHLLKMVDQGINFVL